MNDEIPNYHCKPDGQPNDTKPSEVALHPAGSVDRDALALELTRSFYGYFNGDSAGSASALQYFDVTGRHLPGPKSLIDRTRQIIERHFPQNT